MSNKKLRIGFMGTPAFALEALKAIHASDHELVCVYSQPPRPKGRGHKLQPCEVHAYAQEQNIPVFHPKSLKLEQDQSEFAAHSLDVAIVAAYGLLLPKAILDTPKHGCINIHASLLPRWRGASPIHRAIWAGDKQSGVTLMQMDEGLDTGPEIMKEAVTLTDNETLQTLHDRLAMLGGTMIVDALKKLAENGYLNKNKQNSALSTYAKLLTKTDGKINWAQSSDEIDRQIRALNPWPGVWTEYDSKRLKILQASPLKNTQHQATKNNRPVGTILDKDGAVQCGQDTIIQLETIQPAGKQAMDFKSALNGGYIEPGQLLK